MLQMIFQHQFVCDLLGFSSDFTWFGDRMEYSGVHRAVRRAYQTEGRSYARETSPTSYNELRHAVELYALPGGHHQLGGYTSPTETVLDTTQSAAAAAFIDVLRSEVKT